MRHPAKGTPDSLGEVSEGLTLQEIHRVPRAPLVDAVVHDAHDARMAYSREGVDLAANALEPPLGRHFHGLQRDSTFGTDMSRAVNDSHATAAEWRENAVRTDRAWFHFRDLPRIARILCLWALAVKMEELAVAIDVALPRVQCCPTLRYRSRSQERACVTRRFRRDLDGHHLRDG